MTTLGRYELRSTLGQGAMGVVYRAYDPALDREVALKELHLPPGLSQSMVDQLVDRFYTEARAAGRLSHPCIVTVHDVGTDDNRPYLTMELLEGPTVGDVLAEVGALPPDQAEAVATQVAEALAAAHAQGVIHRDIKPDNCFWLSDGRVKVADFGIARVGTEATRTQAGTVLGTPGYMSPEQVRGEAVTPAADVFSWGAMTYELLTGRAPFGTDDAHAVMYRIVHEDPPDLAALAPGASPSLVAIVRKALAKDPGHRYADARALIADLTGGATPQIASTIPAVRRDPTGSTQPNWSAPAQAAPGRSRTPLLVGIIAGLLLLGGGVTTTALLVSDDPPARTGVLPSSTVTTIPPTISRPVVPAPQGVSKKAYVSRVTQFIRETAASRALLNNAIEDVLAGEPSGLQGIRDVSASRELNQREAGAWDVAPGAEGANDLLLDALRVMVRADQMWIVWGSQSYPNTDDYAWSQIRAYQLSDVYPAKRAFIRAFNELRRDLGWAPLPVGDNTHPPF